MLAPIRPRPIMPSCIFVLPYAKVESLLAGLKPGHCIGALLVLAAQKRCQVAAVPNQDNAFCTAFASFAKSDFTFLLKWTRRARRPRSASTAKSPRAWAAFTTPNV